MNKTEVRVIKSMIAITLMILSAPEAFEVVAKVLGLPLVAWLTIFDWGE